MVNSVNVHDILPVMKVVTFLSHLLENVTSKLIHHLLSHSHCLLGENVEVPEAYEVFIANLQILYVILIQGLSP